MEDSVINTLEKNLNDLINKSDLEYGEYINHNIKTIISNYINDFYTIDGLIYDFKVNSNYPDVEIYIQRTKILEFNILRIEKFERMKNLKKLKIITDGI